MDPPASIISPRILVVEDEPTIADTLIYALKTEGFDPIHCLTGAAAMAEFEAHAAALVILDVGLPDCSGFEWCKKLRERSHVPVLFLTARAAEIDRVVGLEIGGDDYVTKPFSPREVTARVRAILRRGPSLGRGDSPAEKADRPPLLLSIDVDKFEIRFRGQLLDLTRYEFRLLQCLAAQPGRVFSRDRLMESVWDDPGSSLDRTVDAHIKTLRAKLKVIDRATNPIQTQRGVGYAWRPET